MPTSMPAISSGGRGTSLRVLPGPPENAPDPAAPKATSASAVGVGRHDWSRILPTSARAATKDRPGGSDSLALSTRNQESVVWGPL